MTAVYDYQHAAPWDVTAPIAPVAPVAPPPELSSPAASTVCPRLDPDIEEEPRRLVRALHRRDVLALVGGRDHRRSPYNRALRARRQPGSVFKPVVALAAFASGGDFTLETELLDRPIQVVLPDGEWSPANFDGRMTDCSPRGNELPLTTRARCSSRTTSPTSDARNERSGVPAGVTTSSVTTWRTALLASLTSPSMAISD